ncbi:MAG: hypothetical protein HWE18_01770 [Gammaproteobacteria bacterium]|nr:hypothetical protein [Gammaproteobacteria bacterium]
MGMIILPLFLFWFVMAIYAGRLGYRIIKTQSFTRFGLPLIVLTILCIALYVFLGLQLFNQGEPIWAFAILFFFLAGEPVWCVFLPAYFIQLLAGKRIQDNRIKALLFLIITTFSWGALVATFVSEGFIEHHQIPITY